MRADDGVPGDFLGVGMALGEPCARDEDCGDAALCCEHACAALDDCEPVSVRRRVTWR